MSHGPFPSIIRFRNQPLVTGPYRRTNRRLLAIGMAIIALSLALGGQGCSNEDTANSSEPPNTEPPSDPGAPVYLSFATNDAAYGVDEAITVSAILTDPDGIDDLVGGSLTINGEDGVERTMGTFATSAQEGAYTLTIFAQEALEATRRTTTTLDHDTPHAVELRATFFDQAGHAAYRQISVGISCIYGDPAAGSATFGYLTDGACVASDAYGCWCAGDNCEAPGSSSYSCVAEGSGEHTMNEVCSLLGKTCGSCDYATCSSTNANYRRCQCN